jgi:hypothetical protein
MLTRRDKKLGWLVHEAGIALAESGMGILPGT